MSRVIVKNLPQKCSEEKLKEVFSSCGEVTDVRLMRTKAGTFRKFGFIGFSSAHQAQEALKQFNRTYMGSSKIEVELAKPYGDQTLERPWSKYSSPPAKVKKGCGKDGEKGQGSNEGGRSQLGEMLKEFEALEDDPEFQEFLDVHNHSSKVRTWADQVVGGEGGRGTGEGKSDDKDETDKSETVKSVKKSKKRKHVQSDECTDEMEGGADSSLLLSASAEEVEGGADSSLLLSASASDLDYLRSKVVTTVGKQAADCKSYATDGHDHVSSDSGANSTSDDDDVAPDDQGNGDPPQPLATTPYTVKMLGLPFRAGKKDIVAFFHPLKVSAVRFTQDAQGRPSGRAYADFQSEEDLKEALKRNKDCIFHRYIELFRDEPSAEREGVWHGEEGGGAKLKPWEVKAAADGGGEVESITESGRIFVRNLPFSTKEEELEELFGSYGPLTELTLPLDKTTNKSTGLAFVTFMLPEHAAKAYQELDGQIFQGRLLHLLPARAKRGQGGGEVVEARNSSSFKKKKAEKLQSEAGRGHNWNSLFLEANAVVDVMAEKYAVEKGDILDPSSSGTSAAVRLALGETQLVRETKEFLQRHGVNLEVFEQTKPKRSKRVILVKNLPSGCSAGEISKLFDGFGQLVQVIMPPAGISALVEFAEANHAKHAFSKLAYTSFKHLPLYLEWAPVDVIVSRPVNTGEATVEATVADHSYPEDSSNEDSCSVFVKNLNFSTGEDTLKKLFARVGEVKCVSIARKKSPKSPTTPLSMGYGFVEFASEALAKQAIKELQHQHLEGHQLELKLSHRKTTSTSAQTATRKQKPTKQKSAKILVRNVPFEASKHEVKELFSTFGELKTVRLPKKQSAGSGEHRGFGFVEFGTKEDAKRAFDSLSHSTHLYGRRLVLEWAEQEESLDAIRKRTAQHFHGVNVPTARRTKVQEQTLIDTLDKSTA